MDENKNIISFQKHNWLLLLINPKPFPAIIPWYDNLWHIAYTQAFILKYIHNVCSSFTADTKILYYFTFSGSPSIWQITVYLLYLNDTDVHVVKAKNYLHFGTHTSVFPQPFKQRQRPLLNVKNWLSLQKYDGPDTLMLWER